MASTIISVISDTHIGSSMGVSPKKFTIHTAHPKEQHTAQYNEEQKWLLKCWEDYWDYIKQRAGIRGTYRKNRLIIIHLGDVVDGNHHSSTQLIPEPTDQINAATSLLHYPIINLADLAYLTYGTDAHNGGNGEHEIAFASEFGNKVVHGQYFSLDIDGVKFDIGHHGRAGRRDWTASAANYAVEIALEYVKLQMVPPHYILRGHNHVIDDSGAKLSYTRAIACPCWQKRTSFGHKVKSGQARSDIGGLLLDTSCPDYMEFTKARYMPPQEERVYLKV